MMGGDYWDSLGGATTWSLVMREERIRSLWEALARFEVAV